MNKQSLRVVRAGGCEGKCRGEKKRRKGHMSKNSTVSGHLCGGSDRCLEHANWLFSLAHVGSVWSVSEGETEGKLCCI